MGQKRGTHPERRTGSTLTNRVEFIRPPTGKDVNEFHLTDPDYAVMQWLKGITDGIPMGD